MKSFYVGVKAIITDPDRGTLLVHRTDNEYKFWEVPGGRINGDESFDQALTRELHEELLNLGSLAVGDYLGAFRVNRDFPKNHGLMLLYFSVETELPERLQLSNEHDDYTFYDGSGSVPEPINPMVRSILEGRHRL